MLFGGVDEAANLDILSFLLLLRVCFVIRSFLFGWTSVFCSLAPRGLFLGGSERRGLVGRPGRKRCISRNTIRNYLQR